MANIIKKLKRKYKRRKIQTQRLKMEQEQRRAYGVPSGGSYRDLLTQHKGDSTRKAAVTAAAVIVVAALVLLYVEKHSYHDYKIVSSSEQEDVVSTNYVEMSGKILRYSPDGASLVNGGMDAY